MKAYIYLIAILGGLLLSNACSKDHQGNDYIFLNDNTLSDKIGTPTDSSISYLPDSIKINKKIFIVKSEFRYDLDYSRNLNLAKEPLLYNYNLGKEIFRLCYLRSFDKPLIVSIFYTNNKCYLNTKRLNRRATTLPLRDFIYFVAPGGKPPVFTEEQLRLRKESINAINIDNKFAYLEINETIELNIQDWKEFQHLIEDCDYYNLLPSIDDPNIDGARFLLESHGSNNYWVVDRRSDKGKFRKCCEYLLKLTKLDEEIY